MPYMASLCIILITFLEKKLQADCVDKVTDNNKVFSRFL